MSEIERKRDALELAVLLRSDSNAVGRDIFLRSLTQMLAEYVQELLTPDTDDARALHVRAKAIGIIETLSQMGQDMTHVMERAPIQKSIRERVTQSLGSY